MDNKTFIQLVCLGIGHDVDAVSEAINWSEIKSLADKHALSAVVLDGVDRLMKEGRMPSSWAMDNNFKMQWIGSVLKNYEFRYNQYRKAISEMAGFYSSHGYKMMVLKGFSCSMTWPRPEHRPCGDIDIWQFGDYKECDAILVAEKGIKVDDSHHHHTVSQWRGFMVENHYDFINVHSNSENKELESILKDLGNDDTHYTEVLGERVYLPSPNLNALFLLRHALAHFAAEKVTLRQLLDWGFFIEKHGHEVEWNMCSEIIDRFRMRKFFNYINAICVEDLGFDSASFPDYTIEKAVKERILNDILDPEFVGYMPSNLVPRVIFKYRRWQANSWKQKICYDENRLKAFFVSVWSHLLKPSSI